MEKIEITGDLITVRETTFNINDIINNYLTDLYQKENEIDCLETEDEHKKKVFE